MAPSSPYKTFIDITLSIIQDAKETTSSQMVTLVKRWINEGYENLSNRKKRKWLDQQFTVQLNAAVQASCTVTQNSTTVTFPNGTTFASGVELGFWNKGFEEVYNVASATLNVVTLDKPYLGDTNTAASGVVFQRSIILDSSIRDVFQVYHQYQDAPMINVGPQQMRDIQEKYGIQLDEASYYSIFGLSGSSQRMPLFPFPLDAYTLYMDVNVIPDVLSANTDEPLLPMKFRQILYWYGLYKLWLYHRNESQAATALGNYKSLVTDMDGELSPTLDLPQIMVAYPRRRPLRNYSKSFDSRIRDS